VVVDDCSRSKVKPDAADGSRISALESDIASATKGLQNLQGKASTIEDDIKNLEKKILEIGGARLLAQKSKVDGLKLHINVANDEITKAEVAKMKAEKDSAKFAKSIESNKESLAEAENDLDELTEQVKECARYVEEIRSKVEDAKMAQDNSKDDLEKLKKELDEKTEQIRGFKKREVSVLHRFGSSTLDSPSLDGAPTEIADA
jgi:structural maintenance of chromosome 4